MIPNFTIQPGDGTGCSLADIKVRNANGICSCCDNKLDENSKNYGFMGDLCKDCATTNDNAWNVFLESERLAEERQITKRLLDLDYLK